MALGINLLHYSFDYAALSHYGGVSRRINIQERQMGWVDSCLPVELGSFSFSTEHVG